MNISSILITIVGIIIILVLYVASRFGQSKLPNKEITRLPDIKDENGDLFSSVLDDIPASDGSTTVTQDATANNESTAKQQVVLFISAKDAQGIDGDLIKKALFENGLSLGENNIYHYHLENNAQQSTSLFRIANGMEPWTLTDNDLEKKRIAGLSMVMLLPSAIKKDKAITIFLEKADTITQQVNGILKNQQQHVLTDQERVSLLS